MKILFVASNPDQLPTLLLEQEITLIQQKLSSLSPILAPLDFRTFPHVAPDELLDELRNRPADVLHLSAHAGNDGVAMEAGGQPLWIPADTLVSLLRALPVRPRLVYLNACNSAGIADALKDAAVVEFAVGAQVPLRNDAAMRSAATFYAWLAQGASVQAAFDAAVVLVDIFQGGKSSLVLRPRAGAVPECTRLRALPVIVARLPRTASGHNRGKVRFGRKADGYYNIQFGMLDCPPDTLQVVFFVQDWSFVQGDETSFEEDLCTVEIKEAGKPEFWFEGEWDADADYRVFATAVRASGDAFTVRSTPSEALILGLERNLFGQLSKSKRKKVIDIAHELRGVVRGK